MKFLDKNVEYICSVCGAMAETVCGLLSANDTVIHVVIWRLHWLQMPAVITSTKQVITSQVVNLHKVLAFSGWKHFDFNAIELLCT